MRSVRRGVPTVVYVNNHYAGHGPATTVGQERVMNPFLVPHYGGELV